MNEKNNSIINLATLEAKSNKEIIASITTTLASVENSAFKIAVNCAYLMGDEIPYLDGHLKIHKDRIVKSKDLYSAIKKSKATVSRWRKALKYIIEHGHFEDFNNRVYPFSFDKVIMIYDNDLVTDDTPFSALMEMTVSEIEALYKTDAETESETESDGDADATTDATYATGDIVEFIFDGKTFKVDSGILKHFIETECTMG